MSIVSDIMGVIKTRLETVLTTSSDPVYTNNVSTVTIAPKFGQAIVGDRNVSIRAGDIEQDTELSSPGNPPRVAWVLPTTVSGCVMLGDTSEDSVDDAVLTFGAELQTAIAQPAASWHTFSDNAINAEIGPLATIAEEDSVHWAQFDIRITYRVSEDNQAELRG